MNTSSYKIEIVFVTSPSSPDPPHKMDEINRLPRSAKNSKYDHVQTDIVQKFKEDFD